MWVMFDSVDLNQIPAHANAVAGYTSGNWPTYVEMVKRWPHAQHLSIAVDASHDALCLDVEKGDATPEQAPAWFHRQVQRGIEKPVLYASLSVCKESLVPTMEAARIGRESYRLWSAHYTGTPHLCGPSEGLSVAADATQWTDAALGRNLDESLCSDAFFASAPTAYIPHDEANWIKEWDRIKGRKTLPAHLRRLFLRNEMLKRRALISSKAQAEAHGWDKLNRVARWKALKARSN
jgi:hypothetical protein